MNISSIRIRRQHELFAGDEPHSSALLSADPHPEAQKLEPPDAEHITLAALPPWRSRQKRWVHTSRVW